MYGLRIGDGKMWEIARLRCFASGEKRFGTGVQTFFHTYQSASPRLLLNCIGLSHPSDSFSLLSL